MLKYKVISHRFLICPRRLHHTPMMATTIAIKDIHPITASTLATATVRPLSGLTGSRMVAAGNAMYLGAVKFP